MPSIVIDVAGQPGGSPGVAQRLVFAGIDGASPLVTMYLDDLTGVESQSWEVWSVPPGVSVTVTDPDGDTPTWNPAAYIPGTYLVRCIVNGSLILKSAVAWETKNTKVRLPAFRETKEYGENAGWDPALRDIIMKIDQGQSGRRKRKVIDYVDCTVAPPTSNPGDRYILDDSGAVHSDWDGVPQLGIAQTDNGSDWFQDVHEEGDICLVDDREYDMQYVDDGSPAWEPRPPGTQISDKSYSTGVVSGSGFWEQHVETGLDFSSFLGQYVYLNMTSGTTTDTEIRIYNGDPSGGGEVIYQATLIDLTSANHKDANVWWAELLGSGEYWIRVYNHGGADAQYDVRVRVKTDVY